MPREIDIEGMKSWDTPIPWENWELINLSFIFRELRLCWRKYGELNFEGFDPLFYNLEKLFHLLGSVPKRQYCITCEHRRTLHEDRNLWIYCSIREEDEHICSLFDLCTKWWKERKV